MPRFLCCALLAVAACKPSDPKNPETWIARLSASDAKTRVRAVQELRKLRAKQAAPQIAPLLKDPLVKEDAALALQDVGGAAEVPALIEAVDTTVGAGSDQATRVANRTNAKIADALAAIGDPKAGPTLLRLARSKDELVRLAAVQALGATKFHEAVPELTRIVDDESAPPILVKKAVIALGDLRDPAALPALQHALVLERQGVSFLPEASFALFLLGPAAVEPMLKVAQDQDAAYLSWAKENNRAAAGAYAKAALVLGDLGDARAVPVLLAKLKYVDPDPQPQTARLLTNLVREFAASALGRLRAKEAAAPVLALVQLKDAQDADLVAYATEALVWIGDRATAKELAKRAQSGPFELRVLAAQAAALYGEPALRKELSAAFARDAKGTAALCEKSLQELQPTADGRDACAQLAAQLAAFEAPLAAAQACAEVPACWQGKLADPEPLVRARAAYELGRAGATQAAPAIAQLLAQDDLTARLAAARAIEWLARLPDAAQRLRELAPKLGEQLAREQGHAQYQKIDEELRRLQVLLAQP